MTINTLLNALFPAVILVFVVAVVTYTVFPVLKLHMRARCGSGLGRLFAVAETAQKCTRTINAEHELRGRPGAATCKHQNPATTR